MESLKRLSEFAGIVLLCPDALRGRDYGGQVIVAIPQVSSSSVAVAGGIRITAIMSPFQGEDAGSTPVSRSNCYCGGRATCCQGFDRLYPGVCRGSPAHRKGNIKSLRTRSAGEVVSLRLVSRLRLRLRRLAETTSIHFSLVNCRASFVLYSTRYK